MRPGGLLWMLMLLSGTLVGDRVSRVAYARGLVSLSRPQFSWISDAGGSFTSDSQGRVVAVDLRAGWVNDADLARLALIPTLASLDLSETRITDHGLRQLKNAPAIADLSLRYAELITDEGVSALKTWKHLKRLNLEGTKVTDSALRHLSTLNSLESLNISFVLITDAGLEAITSLANLRELNLGGNKLTDAGLQPLRQLPALTVLNLGGVQREDSGLWSVSLSTPGLEAIATLKDLRQLRLNNTLISASGLALLKGLPQLQRLDLNGCSRIGDDAIAVFEAMRSLRSIDLTGTKISAAGLANLRQSKRNCEILLAPSGPVHAAPAEEP
jgi:internalin A